MATFVLNENVVIAATTQRNERDEPDLTCIQLVTSILEVERAHQLAWSVAVFRRWSRQIQILRDQQRAIDPTFMSLFSLVMRDAQRCPCPPGGDPPVLSGESTWGTKLADDCDFIRLAAFFAAVLATADEPLRRDITALGLDTLHGFSVHSPQECLALTR